MPIVNVLPESPDDTENICQPVNLSRLIVSVLLTVLSAVIYAAIFFNGAGFERLFQGFGAELPALTRFFIVSYQYFGVLLLIGLVPCVLLLRNRKWSVIESDRLFWLVFASFGISLLVLGASVAAAYLPVFKLGATV